MADANTTLPEPTPIRPPLSDTPRTTRPTLPVRGETESSPSSMARDFKNLDDAIGDLPMRFVRSSRTLADKLGCRERWDRVEEAHANLRAHEG